MPKMRLPTQKWQQLGAGPRSRIGSTMWNPRHSHHQSSWMEHHKLRRRKSGQGPLLLVGMHAPTTGEHGLHWSLATWA